MAIAGYSSPFEASIASFTEVEPFPCLVTAFEPEVVTIATLTGPLPLAAATTTVSTSIARIRRAVDTSWDITSQTAS